MSSQMSNYRLWDISHKQPDVSYEDVRKMYETRPKKFPSLWNIMAQRLVIVQEYAIVVYVWARQDVMIQLHNHPDHPDSTLLRSKLQHSNTLIVLAQAVVLFCSLQVDRESRSSRAKDRLLGALLMAAFLRLLSAFLRSLTASFSSDTVSELAKAALVIHWATCDYQYAQGLGNQSDKEQQTSPHVFRGGALSLNAALFATILLVSRMKDNTQAYFYTTVSVILFAVYPRTRNAICARYPTKSHREYSHWLFTAPIRIDLQSQTVPHIPNYI